MGGLQNPQKLHGFLKHNAKHYFCDDCAGKATEIDRHEVNTIARTLALFPKEFHRISMLCPQKCSSRDKECTMAL